MHAIQAASQLAPVLCRLM